MNQLLGKEVQIYPGDTVSKWGKVVEIRDHGVLFEVTRVRVPYGHKDYGHYREGELRFIAYSASLSFRLEPAE